MQALQDTAIASLELDMDTQLRSYVVLYHQLKHLRNALVKHACHVLCQDEGRCEPGRFDTIQAHQAPDTVCLWALYYKV